MTNQELLENLKEYQTGCIAIQYPDGSCEQSVHPLTCDMCSEKLVPKILHDKVILECPSCRHIQRKIPAIVVGRIFRT